MEWTLPQKIAPDGPSSRAIAGDLELFPSKIPKILGFKFADMLLSPVVIESIPHPLSGPRDKSGVMTQATLQINMASLTALDRRDWQEVRITRSLTS